MRLSTSDEMDHSVCWKALEAGSVSAGSLCRVELLSSAVESVNFVISDPSVHFSSREHP